jgi:hypothetical protein
MGRTLYLQVLMDDGRIVDAPPPLGKRMRAVSGIAGATGPTESLALPVTPPVAIWGWMRDGYAERPSPDLRRYRVTVGSEHLRTLDRLSSQRSCA